MSRQCAHQSNHRDERDLPKLHMFLLLELKRRSGWIQLQAEHVNFQVGSLVLTENKALINQWNFRV